MDPKLTRPPGQSCEPLKPLPLLDDEAVPGYWRDELQLLPFARIVAGAAVGTNGPFTIGVFADWGHGKTSVLRQARSLIDGTPDYRDVVTVWFNAWQFEREEHPIVPLLASIVAAVDQKRAEADRNAELSKRMGEEGRGLLDRVSRALRAMAYGFSARTKVGIPGFAEVEAGFVAKEMIDRYEHLNADSRAEADPLLMRSLYFNAFDLLARVTRNEGETADERPSPWRPKIVVFVDDLDRCMPDKAVPLLEGIKLALAQPGFVFILAVAHEVIESYLTKRYKDHFGLSKYEQGPPYLDKIIQLSLPVPPHAGRFKEYVANLITTRLAALDPSAAAAMLPLSELLVIGSNHSPRRLVRLINNLLVDSRLRELTGGGDNDGISPADFLGLCAVARSLQLRLNSRTYRILVSDARLCDLLANGGLDRLESMLASSYEPRSKSVGTIEADSDGPEGLSHTLRQRWDQVLRGLRRLDALSDLIEHAFGTRWLTDKGGRNAVEGFLASQRDTAEDEQQQSQLQLVEEAIRDKLGLETGKMLKDQHRTSVAELDLSYGALTDAGVAHLKDLASLQTLDLECTRVGDAGLAHLKGLTSLQVLDLEDTQVSDAGLAHLKRLTSLQVLDLEDTQVSDAGLAHLKGLTSLQVLDLEDTHVGDAGLAHLKKLTSLQTLSLNGTQVSDAGLAHLTELIAIQTLALNRTRVSDAGLVHLKLLNSLEELQLNGTQVGDAGLAHLKRLNSLQRLNLTGTQVGDVGLAHLKGLTSLQTLLLNRTQVGDAGLGHLKRLTSLQRLNLAGTQVGDAGLAHLKGLTLLDRLLLSGTQVSDAGLEQLTGLSSLKVLSLRETNTTSKARDALRRALPKCTVHPRP